jgi:RNA polymerase sigma-70 factor (ECF subfamily)
MARQAAGTASEEIGAAATSAAPDDDALVALARADRAAFGLLYDRYAEAVFRYCDRRLRDRPLAEDATSQVFVRALRGLGGYRGGPTGSFRSWLFAIAHNVTADVLRTAPGDRPLEAALDVVDDAPGPEDLALDEELRGSLRALLAHLTVDQRRIIELRLAGLTGVEIAAALGRHPDAIRAGQLRATNRLRELLGVAAPARGEHDGDA